MRTQRRVQPGIACAAANGSIAAIIAIAITATTFDAVSITAGGIGTGGRRRIVGMSLFTLIGGIPRWTLPSRFARESA